MSKKNKTILLIIALILGIVGYTILIVFLTKDTNVANLKKYEQEKKDYKDIIDSLALEKTELINYYKRELLTKDSLLALKKVKIIKDITNISQKYDKERERVHSLDFSNTAKYIASKFPRKNTSNSTK